MSSSDQADANRSFWDRTSDDYQARHGEFIGRPEPRWGMWQLPEAELGILGDVAGKDVLELGCGAAQWSILLAQRGARPVGLDNSSRQLEHARRLMLAAGVEFPLVLGSAEGVVLPDESFDVVLSDHGAMSWADPYRTVPEAARLLRPGGLLAFSTTSAIVVLCVGDGDSRVGPELVRDYFGLHRIDEREGAATFQLPYGEWIRLFHRHGLEVEDLVEPQSLPDARSTYCDEAELAWSRRWPSESIWKARKRS